MKKRIILFCMFILTIIHIDDDVALYSGIQQVLNKTRKLEIKATETHHKPPAKHDTTLMGISRRYKFHTSQTTVPLPNGIYMIEGQK